MTLTASARELQKIREMLRLSRHWNARFTFVTLDFELKAADLKACTPAAKLFLFANSVEHLEDLQFPPVAFVFPALFVTQVQLLRLEMQHQKNQNLASKRQHLPQPSDIILALLKHLQLQFKQRVRIRCSVGLTLDLVQCLQVRRVRHSL
jgi:hypothetical protein